MSNTRRLLRSHNTEKCGEDLQTFREEQMRDNIQKIQFLESEPTASTLFA